MSSNPRQDFRDMLDEVYGVVEVCGYEYVAWRMLEAIDPIAFDEEFYAWLNSEIEDGVYPEEILEII